ncbi:MAG: lysylphosphatidylglycerol synthase transmembrane domain-containing protein [Catalinimonas sp.]
MDQNSQKIMRRLNPNRIWLPVGIGLAATAYLFVSEYDWEDLRLLASASIGSLLLALIVLAVRDGGYIYRLRHLTGRELSWRSSFFGIMLWEFASAVTPSAVGGTAIAVFILTKEGLKFGRALAFVMLTAVLDNLFFIVASTLALLLMYDDIFPDISELNVGLERGFVYFFVLSYALIAFYTFVMGFALFFRPRGVKWLLLRLTGWKLLRKWRPAANEQGNEIIMAAAELRGKGFVYWARAALSTVLVWSARYLTMNVIIVAFTPVSLSEHVLIFFRQVVMWVTMLISFTPGAAGLAEIAFNAFFEDFLGEFSAAVVLLWRAFSYYLYLIIGALLLPRWLARVVKIPKKRKDPEVASLRPENEARPPAYEEPRS